MTLHSKSISAPLVADQCESERAQCSGERGASPLTATEILERLLRMRVAEDVLGEVWIALERLPSKPKNLGAWVRRVVKSVRITEHRYRTAQKRGGRHVIMNVHGIDAECPSSYPMRGPCFERLIVTLSEKEQVLCRLRFVEGLTIEEAACELGMQTKDTRKLNRQAMDLLKEQWQDYKTELLQE